MRPLALNIQGFMAFKNPVEIDFRDKTVFVLTGPTGAGKSSLLDAICFALYGETPRIGSKDIKKLIYQDVENPRQQAQVSFSFRHLETDYRITRQISQSTHRVELETRDSSEAEWQKHTTGSVSEFKNTIPKLLGLDFKAFSRVLLLPQGGFDQFLKQDGPDYRRKVLMGLAQLDVYEKIQQEADLHRKELSQNLTALDGELRGMGEVSTEDLEQLKNTLTHNQEELTLKIKANREAEQAFKSAEALWQLLQNLTLNLAEQEVLEAKQDEINQIKQQLEQGRKLQQLAPELNFLAQGEQKQAKLENQIETLEKQKTIWQQEQAQLQQQEQSLLQDLDKQPAWEAERERLRELKPEVEKSQQLQTQLKGLSEQIKQREMQIQAALKRIKSSEEGLAEGEKTLNTLETQRQSLAVVPERLELLQEALPELKRLQTVELPALLASEKKWKQQVAELVSQQERKQALEESLVKAEEAFKESERALQNAQEYLRKLEVQEQAAILRQTLEPGHSCPVCEQTVHELPPALDTEALSQQTQEVEALRKQQKELEWQWQQYLREQVSILSEERNLNLRVSELEVIFQNQQSHCASMNQALEVQLSVSELPDWQLLKQELDQLRQKSQSIKTLEHQLSELKQKWQQYQQNIELGKQELSLHQQELATRQSEREAVQMTAEACEQKLKQALQVSQDYAQTLDLQLNALQNRLQKLAVLHKQHQQAVHQLEQQGTRLESELLHTHTAFKSLQTENTTLSKQLSTQVLALGYASLAEARQLLPADATLKDWEEALQKYASQTQSVLREKIRLQEQIAGRSLTQEALLEQQEQLEQIQTHVQTLSRDIAVQENQFTVLQTQLERSHALQAQRSQLKHQLGLYERIYDDLGSRKLPDFLAKRIMERVISSGSEELSLLSNERYRFQLDESEELVILDAWNANEPRSVKTLSGGESFLASLALALALNNYLSTGIQLDSLFIDEGFGTLDPETLEMAAEVIEKLQVGGKCIGVITHIPELAERFESRINIVKSEGGAEVFVT